MARVLVIEDERSIAMVLRLALGEEGHEVITAGDGRSGFEQLINNTPDVVLLDLVLPQMNGKSVVEKMRNSEQLRNIPVIIISGSMPTSDVLPPQGSYNAFIGKPFDLAEVLATVEELIQENRYKTECISVAG